MSALLSLDLEGVFTQDLGNTLYKTSFLVNTSEIFVLSFVFLGQLFLSKLIPCPFKCSHLLWPVWLKVSTASDQVSCITITCASNEAFSVWFKHTLWKEFFFAAFRKSCTTHSINLWLPFSEWAQLAPALFAGFIPQINPPALESLLPDYAAHDQKLQMELSMNGFSRSVFWGFPLRR